MRPRRRLQRRALITWVDDGRQALGRPQVIGRYPLARVLSEGDYVYHAYVPIAHLSGGGHFAAAIEGDAGDGVMVSNTQPLYGLLKPWLRPRSWRAATAYSEPPHSAFS